MPRDIVANGGRSHPASGDLSAKIAALKTLDAANRAFAPSPEEIAWSYKIIAAFDAALADGKALAVCDGKLIENLHVENAKRVVALSEAIGARSGEDPARAAAAT